MLIHDSARVAPNTNRLNFACKKSEYKKLEASIPFGVTNRKA